MDSFFHLLLYVVMALAIIQLVLLFPLLCFHVMNLIWQLKQSCKYKKIEN